jgi:molecular chaperone DnaK (HSP70)
MGLIEGGQQQFLENAEVIELTPSVVTISKSGERLIGHQLKDKLLLIHKIPFIQLNV